MAETKRSAERYLCPQEGEGTGSQANLARRSELLPGSALFPSRLMQLKDVPKKLYALGNVHILEQPAISIVGARKATPYGLTCAERFGRIAASHGITIVSGGAIGCDMAAHRGALDAGGTTVVVLGSGADVVYPLRARELFLEVLEAGGVLLSEAPWGSAPLSWAFSKRNRIIAALSKATLIVEAGLPSGTFQTADHTLALGNDVLVVPGPIFSKQSKGSNRLLTQGATPIVDDESYTETLKHIFGSDLAEPYAQAVINWQDGEEDAGTVVPAQKSSPQEIKERRLVEHITDSLMANPMTIDELALAHKTSVTTTIRAVTQLEIRKKVKRLRDGRYCCAAL